MSTVFLVDILQIEYDMVRVRRIFLKVSSYKKGRQTVKGNNSENIHKRKRLCAVKFQQQYLRL